MIFQSYMSMLYIRIDVRHICLASIVKFATDKADMENIEEMLGIRVRRAGDNRRRDGGDGWSRDGGDRWGNVYGRRGVGI